MRLLGLMFMLCAILPAMAAEEDLHGQAGCDKYPWDMNREWSLLLTDPFPIQSLKATDPDARFLPLDRRLHVRLHLTDQVRVLPTPEKAQPGNNYSGLGLFRLPWSKKYRISTNKPIGIDVFGQQGPVKASKVAVLPGCNRLTKTVVYPLEGETDYWLQLTGSPDPEIVLLITLDR